MSYYQLKSLLSGSNGLDFDLAYLKTITSNINSLNDTHDCIKMLYDFLASEQQVEIVRCLWVVKNWCKLNDTFRDIAATSLNTKIKCLVNYKGVNDQLYGKSLLDKIHMLSEDCLDVMFVDTTQERRESMSGGGKSMIGTSSTNYNQNCHDTSNKSVPASESHEVDPYSIMRKNLMSKLKSPKKPIKTTRSNLFSNRAGRLTDSNQIPEDTQHSFLIKETRKLSINKNTKNSRIFHIIKGSRVGPLLNTLEKNKLKSIFSEDSLTEYIDIFTTYDYSSVQGVKLYESFSLFQKTTFYKSTLKTYYTKLNTLLEKEKLKFKNLTGKMFIEEIIKVNKQNKPEDIEEDNKTPDTDIEDKLDKLDKEDKLEISVDDKKM